jgi:hypothetical protein
VQAKPPSPTSSTHCCQYTIVILTLILDRVAAETRRHIRLRPKAKHLPNPLQRSQVSTNVCLRRRHIRSSIPRTSSIAHSLPNRSKNTYTLRRERIPHHYRPFSRPRRAEFDLKEEPTHQTAGRPSLPRCRTYGSLLESSD